MGSRFDYHTDRLMYHPKKTQHQHTDTPRILPTSGEVQKISVERKQLRKTGYTVDKKEYTCPAEGEL